MLPELFEATKREAGALMAVGVSGARGGINAFPPLTD
jgi:hypothetical protein